MVSDPERAPFNLDQWSRCFRELEATLARQLRDEALPTEALLMYRFVEMQFHGQVHTLRVPVEDTDLSANDGGIRLVDRFTELYEARYGAGTAYRKVGVEVLTFVVEGHAALPRSVLPPAELGDRNPVAACDGERNVYLHETGKFTAIPIYRAERLKPGNEFGGPAIVEAEDTTVLVHADQRLWVDGYRNLRLELEDRDS
jgi:N-methylhydantoinase A/oxoprolinase/acetone carboxylase beta subunit